MVLSSAVAVVVDGFSAAAPSVATASLKHKLPAALSCCSSFSLFGPQAAPR